MIPATWLPYYRVDDGELLGYLVPEDGAHRPVTVFGYPLDDPMDESAAESVLESVGLSYLADKWLLALEDGETMDVIIQEASPDRLVVANADFAQVVGTIGDRYVLDVPESGRLTRK